MPGTKISGLFFGFNRLSSFSLFYIYIENTESAISFCQSIAFIVLLPLQKISYLSQEDDSDKGLVKNCCISKLLFASKYANLSTLEFNLWSFPFDGSDIPLQKEFQDRYRFSKRNG